MQNIVQIAFAHVGKSFDGGRGARRVQAVDDVSLDVSKGEFLAIVGGSGSGKTTLLLANRLIDADTGTIHIDGADVRAADPAWRFAGASVTCFRASVCFRI